MARIREEDLAANTCTLQSSALSLSYSAVLYCAQVWSHSTHLTQVWSMHGRTLLCGLSMVLSSLHIFPGYQFSLTSNHVPCEGRVPWTGWWQKLRHTTVGPYILKSSVLHSYEWHPRNHYGTTCNQFTPKAVRGKTGSRLQWSTRTQWMIVQSGNLPWQQGSVVNHFWTAQGCCGACRKSFNRLWSVFLQQDPNDVAHSGVLSECLSCTVQCAHDVVVNWLTVMQLNNEHKRRIRCIQVLVDGLILHQILWEVTQKFCRV